MRRVNTSSASAPCAARSSAHLRIGGHAGHPGDRDREAHPVHRHVVGRLRPWARLPEVRGSSRRSPATARARSRAPSDRSACRARGRGTRERCREIGVTVMGLHVGEEAHVDVVERGVARNCLRTHQPTTPERKQSATTSVTTCQRLGLTTSPSGRGSGRPASARPRPWGSSAASFVAQALAPRRAPRGRAAAGASTRRRRSPPRVTDRRVARRHRRDREVRRVRVHDLVPLERAAHPALGVRAPSTPTRPSGHGRSGCSRGRRCRRAPPSTTSWSRASACAARPRGQGQRAPPHLGEVPARLDADVDVDAPGARRLRVADEPCSSSTSWMIAATPGRRRTGRPAAGRGPPGARRDGRRRARRTGHGLRSMHPRLAAHTMWATSTGHSSSACRPLGNETRTVSIHSGRFGGTRFWKNGSSVAPFGYRFEDRRPLRTPRSAPSPTATKYCARSSLVSPRAGKNTLSGFVTFTVWPDTSS